MKPIGLKFKNPETNPYTGKVTGEPMVIHQCANCNHISSNRIAGDDNPFEIIKLLEISSVAYGTTGIKLLTKKDKNEILSALFGYNYQKSLPNL